MLERLGAHVREVRVPADLAGLDGFVIPGGESTTMTLGIDREGLAGPLRDLAAAGLGRLKPEKKLTGVEGDYDCPVDIKLDFPADARDACPCFAGRYIRGEIVSPADLPGLANWWDAAQLTAAVGAFKDETGFKLLFGASRKSFIARIDPATAIGGTL